MIVMVIESSWLGLALSKNLISTGDLGRENNSNRQLSYAAHIPNTLFFCLWAFPLSLFVLALVVVVAPSPYLVAPPPLLILVLRSAQRARTAIAFPKETTPSPYAHARITYFPIKTCLCFLLLLLQ